MSATRVDLHRIGAHVLGRRRFEVSGHFGLRASPGGLATPAFGPEPETVRLAGSFMVREVGAASTSMALQDATLRQLAHFAGAELEADFSAGPDTPPLGPVDRPLALDEAELAGLVEWFGLGWSVLDEVTSRHPAWATRSTIQLWPEHFDAATAVQIGRDAGVNLGFSAGDAFCEEPYAYVGPWGTERPGSAAYWNAPFGAYLPRSGAGAGAAACAPFIRRGLETLTRG
jgi:hypothetical protein